MQRVPDPYRVLGVGREATTPEVKAAHRRLAKRYHPDAPHADATRFLAVQDAYELLRDPLRRREWDRRHAPGPVRAEATASGQRRRRSAAGGPPVGPEPPASPRSRRRAAGTDTTFGPNDRPPSADRWTWTAEGVPWWEDSGAPRTRRASRRRPSEGAGDRPGASARRPSGSTGDGDSGRPDPASARAAASDETTGGAPAAAGPPSDFDVFSRSSGAAWSSASRAYFRRRAADMPTGAANPDTPRWTTPVGAPAPRRYDAPATAAEPAAAAEPVPAPEHGPAAAAAQPGAAGSSLGATLAALLRRGGR